ncbi:SRPBCC family protein [Nocardia callitridis]|uniref:Coenzyme Q-binding protein COQ10 START domain-containing protein n=1 Tax=Nocardia callitridis TaxID=648753 RepID=A0ABP9K1U4_9NOCA
MRTKTDIRFVVDLDPAHVMDALAAVEMLPEWSSTYRDARVATRDEAGRPERVFVKADVMGSSDLQVLEYEWTATRSSWTVVDSSRGAKGGGWFDLAETEDGTEIWYHTDVQISLPVPGILLKRTLRKASEAMVPSFIAFVEQFPAPDNPEQYEIL